jgi:hypothetical protein
LKWRPVKDSSSKLRAPFHLHSAASPRQRGHDFLQARQLVLSSVFLVPPTTRVRSTRRVTRAVRCRDTSDRLLHPTYLLDLHPRSWLPTCLIEGDTAFQQCQLPVRSKDMAFSRRRCPLRRLVRKARGLLALFVRSGYEFASDIPSPPGPPLRHHRPVCVEKGFPSPKDLGCLLRALVKGRALHNPRCLPSVCVRAPRHAACAA